MPAPIFVDLENGGHVRIDPPTKSTSSVRFMITTPRQFGDAGETLEQATVMDLFTSRKGAEQFRDALTLALDDEVKKMVGL